MVTKTQLTGDRRTGSLFSCHNFISLSFCFSCRYRQGWSLCRFETV